MWWWEWTSPAELISEPSCCWMGLPLARQVFSTDWMGLPVSAWPRELLMDKLASQADCGKSALPGRHRAEQAGHGAVSVFSDPVRFVWWTLMELMRGGEPAWAIWGWILGCARVAWWCLLEISTGCSACFRENLSCALASCCEGMTDVWRDREQNWI